MYDKTVAANKAGDFSPLWGTCMGFQWLLLAATQNTLKLDPSDGTQMDAENYTIPLDFTKQVRFLIGRMLKAQVMATYPLTRRGGGYIVGLLT